MSRWLRTQKAFALFSYGAWTVVCLGVFMVFMLTPWFQQVDALPGGDYLLRVLGGVLGLLGAPGGLILWFGMVVFCALEDRFSSLSAKIFWFALFFTASFLGAAVYFFTVYRKQVQAAGVVTSS
jgi:hypothetical protein